MLLLRRIFRVCTVILHVLTGALFLRCAVLWDTACGRALHRGLARRVQAWWCNALCRILGFTVRVRGQPLVDGPVLLVANHVSWIDIPIMAALGPVGFLSKSEVRRWPLIGRVATGLGTLYIERGCKDAAADAVAAMADRLAQGHKVLFFPEGTTGDGTRLLAFRPRLYQAAFDAKAPVQPVAISYHMPDGELSRHAPFIDDDTLLGHLLKVAAVPVLEVRVQVAPPIASEGLSRTELAQRSRQCIADLLGQEAERSRVGWISEAQSDVEVR